MQQTKQITKTIHTTTQNPPPAAPAMIATGRPVTGGGGTEVEGEGGGTEVEVEVEGEGGRGGTEVEGEGEGEMEGESNNITVELFKKEGVAVGTWAIDNNDDTLEDDEMTGVEITEVVACGEREVVRDNTDGDGDGDGDDAVVV